MFHLMEPNFVGAIKLIELALKIISFSSFAIPLGTTYADFHEKILHVLTLRKLLNFLLL